MSDVPTRRNDAEDGGPPWTQRRVPRYAGQVLHAATVDLVGRLLTGLLLAAGGGLGLLIWKGGSVPAWVAVLAVVIVVGISILLGVRAGRERERFAVALASRDEHIGELTDRVSELETHTSDYEEIADSEGRIHWALERFELYTAHTADVLDRLQRVLAGELQGVSIPNYIERGILDPARDVLQGPHDDIRISVLLPQGDRWTMIWCAGHSLDGQKKYAAPIADTLSRVAYESGEATYWPDVTEDDRFSANPNATRPFHSMLSQPIMNGSHVVGVLNVISSVTDAFDPAEQQYLASLGSVIGVALGVHLEKERGRVTHDE